MTSKIPLHIYARELRLARDLSQKDVAAATGISAPMLSQLERGLHPKLQERLVTIINYLNETPGFWAVPFENRAKQRARGTTP